MSKSDQVKVEIYTDGACSGNPGNGGWAAILLSGKHKKEISGFQPQTTNNRMELLAVINALSALKKSSYVTLYSDSAYVVNAFILGWIWGWQTNGWRNSQNKPIANQDLWQRLIDLSSLHKIVWVKVKGHADNKFNNRCDELAVLEIKNNIHE